MKPAIGLKSLLGAAGVALLACLLAAQKPPANPETCAPSGDDNTGVGALSLATGPIGAIHAHLCGFHFYSGDGPRALRVEHYCSQVSADIFQCIIYDSDRRDARLIGIEYIISEALFRQLPAAEKKLWHSHRYEVMSGQLSAPGLSGEAEQALMRGFVSTYGKTWHLWQVDRGDPLPLGLPKLMMGFTADGQADPAMVAARDRDEHIDAAKLRARRADLPTRPVAAGADGWQHGPAFQINDDLLR
jgi:hypothetical protein